MKKRSFELKFPASSGNFIRKSHTKNFIEYRYKKEVAEQLKENYVLEVYISSVGYEFIVVLEPQNEALTHSIIHRECYKSEEEVLKAAKKWMKEKTSKNKLRLLL